MKTILSHLFALTLGTAFGQFIPQPMGYNPDANSDGFIGVDDVLETLVLFGNAFDNGDSTVVATVQLSGDNQGWPNNLLGEELILPNADVIYLDVMGYDTGQPGLYSTYNVFKMKLPEGTGFKTLLVIPPHYRYIPVPETSEYDGMWNVEYQFFSDNDQWTSAFEFSGGGNMGEVNYLNRKWYVYMFLRDHQGFWRPLNGLGTN